ncbi:MAG: 16S rRNA (cytosine(1402)-N(4))-methyltransferase RsmH [Blastocatellia bacterium]
MSEELHQPVMPEETIALLDAARGGWFVDATLGMGGHTARILEASPEARVLGLDRDAEAIDLAGRRLAGAGERIRLIHADYRGIKQAVREQNIESVAGILADLGVSSFQFDTPERGFSFRTDSPLDMRMDRSQGETAADLVNELPEERLADIIFEFGEERASRRIARRIVAERGASPIRTTAQLADLVIKAVHQRGHWRTHPATRTFQALRIAVNRELEGLDGFVADAVDLLESGGRLVIISFHSLEDRIIKQALRYQSGQCKCPPDRPECVCGTARRVEIMTRKAIQPSGEEIASNPRARSAKLRACRKI